MIWRTLIGAAIAYIVGFGVFMASLSAPVHSVKTDAIVVLTGGRGRIERGVALLEAEQAKRMLVSGVPIGVTPADLARENKAPARLFACCIDLGNAAVDTRTNAEETAEWVRGHGFKSIRLVTTDWHMARARMELANALGDDVRIIPDGVRSNPRKELLLREYNKLILRWIALRLGIGK